MTAGPLSTRTFVTGQYVLAATSRARREPGRRTERRRIPLRALAAVFVMLAAMSVAVPSAWAKPAHCNKAGTCTPPSKLKWLSPSSIADGVAATFSSIGTCPNVHPDGSPLQGTLEVQVIVLFSLGGGMGDVAPVAADGSWTFVKAFDAGGTRDRKATVVASCIDVTNTGVDIADYRPHAIAVNP
jgi:hypothetical protein